MWCPRASPDSSARSPNSPIWASRCITSRATTTSGPTNTSRRSVASSSIRSLRPPNSMARFSSSRMATGWAIPPRASSFSRASSTTDHSNVDYFIYGHRHIEVDLQLTKKARMVILGDWITQFSYIVWDGEHLLMSQYIEGESQP